MTIPAQLKAWRQARGLTQAGAAERLQINRRTLENWECGRAAPRGLARTALLQILTAPAITPAKSVLGAFPRKGAKS